MKMHLLCALVVLAVFLPASPLQASPLAVSAFDRGTDGWEIVEIYYNSGLGQPPTIVSSMPADYDCGYIYKRDPNLTNTYLFSAPAKFLGNVDVSYGRSLSWDLFNYSDGNTDTGLILVGGGKTLYRQNMLPPTGDGWSHYDIKLAPSSDWTVNAYGGVAATEADFHTVLGSLENLYIMGDWLSGLDMASLDNVQLAPEPASLSLLSLGIFTLLRRKRRRRLNV